MSVHYNSLLNSSYVLSIFRLSNKIIYTVLLMFIPSFVFLSIKRVYSLLPMFFPSFICLSAKTLYFYVYSVMPSSVKYLSMQASLSE